MIFKPAIAARIRSFAAIAALATTVLAGAKLEYNVRFECYYRELGTQQAHLSRVQRILFTILLATKDHLAKEKRQA